MNKIIICHNCKAILAPGSSYCSQCGAKITEADHVRDDAVRANSIYLAPGTVLHMNYRINGVIGQGGFGITYDGTDLKLDMHVAIKEYFPHPMANRTVSVSNDVTCSLGTSGLYDQGLNNFLKEARNMAKFAGEDNFVSVHDYFSENNTAYIIMEYVEGENLKQYMQRHGRFTLDEAMPVIMPVMNALEKIHKKKMIHRDVSPANIMILPDGRVRLLDFGAARDVTLDSKTMTTMSAVYKYGYSPIEQLTHDMKQGPFTDIYALCATIYEMLTGSTPPSPFTRLQRETLIPPSQMGVGILPVQEAALMKGLAVYGENRIQTIEELRTALCGYLQGGGGQVYDRKERGRTYPGGPGPGGGGGARDYTVDWQGILRIVLGGVAAILVLLLAYMVYHNISVSRSTGGSSQQASLTETEEAGAEVNEEESAQEPEISGENTEANGENTEEAVDNTEASREETESSSGPAQGSAVSIGGWSGSAGTTQAAAAEEEEPAYDFPEGSLYFGGHHYYIYDDVDTTWTAAMDKCKERGGYLAVVNDAEENEALYQYMVEMGFGQAFFGLTDSFDEGDWIYIYGDDSDFRDWGTNVEGRVEPNNADGEENYAEFDIHMHDGHWNDAQFGRNAYTPSGELYENMHAYICEWDY